MQNTVESERSPRKTISTEFRQKQTEAVQVDFTFKPLGLFIFQKIVQKLDEEGADNGSILKVGTEMQIYRHAQAAVARTCAS